MLSTCILILFSVTGALGLDEVQNIASSRPWYFDAYSLEFVSVAAKIRQTAVPEPQASSVAKQIVDKGMEPAQFTEMAELGIPLITSSSINANSVSNIAEIFASAYTSMHTQQEYSQYISYVKQHSSLFNLDGLRTVAIKNPLGTAFPTSSKNLRQQREIIISLLANSVGRHAIETMSAVVNSYLNDFGVQRSPMSLLDAAMLIYNFV